MLSHAPVLFSPGFKSSLITCCITVAFYCENGANISRSIWLKTPTSGGCGRNGAQADLQAGSCMLSGNVEIWGLGGRHTNHKERKNPVSAQTEWAACIISVTSVVTEAAL